MKFLQAFKLIQAFLFYLMLYIEESIKCYLYCILIIAIFMYVGTREYENIHGAKSSENIKLAEIKKLMIFITFISFWLWQYIYYQSIYKIWNVCLDIKFDDLVFILRQSFLFYGTKFSLHGISIDPKPLKTHVDWCQIIWTRSGPCEFIESNKTAKCTITHHTSWPWSISTDINIL